MAPGSSDAVVVGAGPNGLAAAIELGRRGWSVTVLEGASSIGGGCRTAELTLPGFRHDVCSAIHPLAVASPFLRTLRLEERGLQWIEPVAALAHPLDDGSAAVLLRSVDETADRLDRADTRAYRSLMTPLVRNLDPLLQDLLGPVRVPRRPFAAARFGLQGLRSVAGLARSRFQGERGRALLAGMGAHSTLPLDRSPTAAVALLLGALGHSNGWPFPAGGSERIVEAMARVLAEVGGEVRTDNTVSDLSELAHTRAVLLDVTPRQLLSMAGAALTRGYRRSLARFRYGPGVFKVDYALAGPVPWKAPECALAGTVHVGGTLEEIASAEGEVWRGGHPQRPFVLVAQQSLFDPARAPQGKHTLWTYTHVPNGSEVDMTEAIEGQLERFAPGFRDLVLARAAMGPADLQRYNPNYVGGDINGGVLDLAQLYTRPAARLNPYTTPLPGVYLCSSSTPPGGGVHGLCGFHAARAAMRGRAR